MSKTIPFRDIQENAINSRMSSQRDIYAAAQVLITQYGDDAETYASGQMQAFMENDDVKGASLWLSISAAIDVLRMRPQGKLH